MMEIISHRGFWEKEEEKNSKISFELSFSKGYGTETDIRDCNGELYISHNMPLEEDNNLTVDDFFSLYNSYQMDKTLALNIKADGLQELLKEKIKRHKIKNYFVFDMSIPDTRAYIRNEIDFFVRLSEDEKYLAFSDKTKGVWLDAFDSLWYTDKLIFELLNEEKKIAIVSFELHRRDHLQLWNWLKKNQFHKYEKLILCTDLPDEANCFFYK